MQKIDLERSIEELMADSRLVELCELQRTGDEVLDVISLSENQHSDILAWMLDAREGHGQGDEILRDLLISASTLLSSGTSRLDGRSSTARFFAEWPPSRIRTTSFGAAFTARELGMSAAERVDLFVIDAQNKFVLLIENKAGATHSEDQLSLYRRSFNAAMMANPRLREYAQVCMAIDRNFDTEGTEARPSEGFWLHLGYDWLETSANRALMHVQRGNAAARLVVSYCNRQTDWENPTNDRCIRLAIDLHQSYPNPIRHLISFSRGRVEREWLASKSRDQSHLMFLLQNKSAIALLKETQGMASVRAAMLESIPLLPRDSIENGRASLSLCPTGCEDLGRLGRWPVFVNVKYSDSSQAKYTVAVCWNAKNARSDADADNVRKRLINVDARFSKHSGSRWRGVTVSQDVGLSELLKKMVDLNVRISKALLE